MAEIILCVIPVISIASFSSTSRSSSKASNLITFMSIKYLAFDRKSSLNENSTTGDSRPSLVQRIFLVFWEISRWSDVLFSPCPSLRLFGEQIRSFNHFFDWSWWLRSRWCIDSFIGVIIIRVKVVWHVRTWIVRIRCILKWGCVVTWVIRHHWRCRSHYYPCRSLSWFHGPVPVRWWLCLEYLFWKGLETIFQLLRICLYLCLDL